MTIRCPADTEIVPTRRAETVKVSQSMAFEDCPILTMEGQNCEQQKERGSHGGCEYSSQTSRQVVMICQGPEERKIVREIGRSCNGQSRSGDYCAQMSITEAEGENEKSSRPRSSDAAMTMTSIQNATWFIPSFPPI